MTHQNSMLYRYTVFGMNIDSEIALPELMKRKLNDDADVFITKGEVPQSLDNILMTGVRYQIGYQEFLLYLDNIAKFYVRNGSQITIHELEGADPKDIRLFLLGSCFGALLHQRNKLVLHASAIIVRGKAVLFAGISGVGKSSTANAFRLKGYQMLTDDVCPIDFQNDKVFALPGYPQSKLWEDTLEKLDIDYEGYEVIRNKISKRKIPLTNDFCSKPTEIHALYILTTDNTSRIAISSIQDGDKFQAIKNMTYRRFMVKEMGGQEYHFQNGIRLAQSIHVKRLKRPQTDCLSEVVSAIEFDLDQEIHRAHD